MFIFVVENMRNLLLVSNYPSDVGYAWWLMEHFWINLADYFSRREGKAFLIYPKVNEIPHQIAESPITCLELSYPSSLNNIKNIIKIIKFIKENRITDLYLTDKPWFDPLYTLFRLSGVKNIVVHDHTPGDRPPITGVKGALKALRNKINWICADSQICVSELMRRRSLVNARIPADKCYVVQNGIPEIQGANMSKNELTRMLNIPEHSLICVTTGRAHPYKRFDLILKTVFELERIIPDHSMYFLLLGDGPDMNNLKQLASELKIEHRVFFLGFTKNIHDYLQIADIAIHAAKGEAFSLSIVEYMRASLPVLVPDIPSVKQAVQHGYNGYVFEEGSPRSAAFYVSKLIKNENLRKQLGANSRRRSLDQYSIEKCTNDFKKVCELVFQ
jgi:glycosyltransferase involved in cell wall biosynthesis